ncbi:nucleotidyl transferase AbiEii/AbiGii toxin family protein [Nocardia cyriacigeorgica]|uniref:nucleotidyl transferase AbiEii/AbiGii toxin family protein n=1 Tax=Nocardia cyriacigeorgica TaxID=135487 RepID=UPI0018943BA9|nr:nucleotidyl transferase AbiEii/AbiGii toxin family protein [Nocardia cyriacigeorgica]MBF6289889.1 nucleotidyl transferase AbiEii/AbiGii toxin family protein [Nocardia cyriacigeorgica]
MTARERTDGGLQRAINERIKKQARALKRPPAELHREFFMQRMLAKIFHDPGVPWVLKGGTGLLVRIPGARHSQDLDLLHPDTDLAEAFQELRGLVETVGQHDRFRFSLDVKARREDTWQLHATPYLGANALQHFPIDLTAGRQLVGEIDRVSPRQVIEIPDLDPPPPFSCYPLADQIADKLAAMYEFRGAERAPSTRWRDLADLLLIISNFEFDAASTRTALDNQRECRTLLELPAAVHAPGPRWEAEYPRLAAATILPAALHRLDAALLFLGRCVDPLLCGDLTAGRWDPATNSWNTVPVRVGG